MGSGELHVLMGGGGAKGPLRIFKSKSRRVKIQTALKDLVELYRIRLCWPYFFTCDVTGRSNKVKLYWFK